MKRLILSALFFLCAAVSAPAYTDTGVKYTAGPDGYSGFSAFAEWGDDDYYLRPSLNTYKSDLADRYSGYAFGAGLDREAWSAGAELSIAPETGGYQNTALFGNFSYNLAGAPPEGAALQHLSAGVFAGITAHEDAYSRSTTTVSGPGRMGSSQSSLLNDAFTLTQTDYGISAAVKLFGVRASGRFTKTVYDKDITAEARELPLDIGGIGASGFPDTSVSARLSFPGLPLSPSAGYTKSAYLLDQPDSEAFSAGLSVGAGPVELSGGWEGFSPGGGAGRSDYYSIGVTVSF